MGYYLELFMSLFYVLCCKIEAKICDKAVCYRLKYVQLKEDRKVLVSLI